MLKKNDIIELTIESCSLDGSGVGRYNGMAIFVPKVCPGEIIKAHILKVKKNFAFAKVEEFIKMSPERISPICPVYKKCGGCSFSHINYTAELKIKESHVKECLKRIGNSVPEFEPIFSDNITEHYRNKAQFPVSINENDISIGFYSQHSHRVINCPGCILQPKRFESIINSIKDYIITNHITIYNELENSGLLRHIFIRIGKVTNEIMVCLIINGKSLPNENELINKILSADKDVKSVIINSNTEKTNVILGKKYRTIYGNDYIEDVLCGKKFRISPASFYQVNHDMAQELYRKATEYADLTGSETLIDLYCGTGTIGLTMADKCKYIIGVEIVPQAIENAKVNADLNGITNARFICADASEAANKFLSENIKPDVIILDPPRKGCSPDTVECAAKMNPKRIVYISCDPATLARDLKLFNECGYKTIKCSTFDLFARTGHVESVCLLRNNID